MAKYCTNCGHELREGDKFCAECGAATEGGSVQPTQLPQYEYCEIRYSAPGGLWSKGQFWADASGPNGRRNAGQSSACKSETYSDGFANWFEGPSQRCAEALNELMRNLSAIGWELLPSMGKYQWSYKYRRPLNSRPDRITDVPLPPPARNREEMTKEKLKVMARGYGANKSFDYYGAMAVVESFLESTDPHSVDHVKALWFDKVELLEQMNRINDIPRVLDQALALVDESLRSDPDNSEWWSQRAAILNKLGRKDESDEAHRKAEELKRR